MHNPATVKIEYRLNRCKTRIADASSVLEPLFRIKRMCKPTSGIISTHINGQIPCWGKDHITFPCQRRITKSTLPRMIPSQKPLALFLIHYQCCIFPHKKTHNILQPFCYRAEFCIKIPLKILGVVLHMNQKGLPGNSIIVIITLGDAAFSPTIIAIMQYPRLLPTPVILLLPYRPSAHKYWLPGPLTVPGCVLPKERSLHFQRWFGCISCC